ncbi:MAG: HAD-IA family hydrolase [Bacilli bacterium]|nr:HAD-IA family hydrolase [Bacilli bacterium]
MLEYVFFDLDGTLTDPKVGITGCVAYALEKFGINVENHDDLAIFIGPPLYNSFVDFYGFSDENAKIAIEYYRERYTVTGWKENYVYEGIYEVLDTLKKRGYKLVIATSKPENTTHMILEHFDLLKYFDFVSGATLDGTRNHKDEVIKHALDSLNITDSHKVMMVGDRKFDILGAKVFGIETIAVEYGYGNLQEFQESNAAYVVKNSLEILDIIK